MPRVKGGPCPRTLPGVPSQDVVLTRLLCQPDKCGPWHRPTACREGGRLLSSGPPDGGRRLNPTMADFFISVW